MIVAIAVLALLPLALVACGLRPPRAHEVACRVEVAPAPAEVWPLINDPAGRAAWIDAHLKARIEPSGESYSSSISNKAEARSGNSAGPW